jgi:hypothetical protein
VLRFPREMNKRAGGSEAFADSIAVAVALEDKAYPRVDSECKNVYTNDPLRRSIPEFGHFRLGLIKLGLIKLGLMNLT